MLTKAAFTCNILLDATRMGSCMVAAYGLAYLGMVLIIFYVDEVLPWCTVYSAQLQNKSGSCCLLPCSELEEC